MATSSFGDLNVRHRLITKNSQRPGRATSAAVMARQQYIGVNFHYCYRFYFSPKQYGKLAQTAFCSATLHGLRKCVSLAQRKLAELRNKTDSDAGDLLAVSNLTERLSLRALDHH
eukprot:676791-Amphidinium_carterae.1